MLTISLQKSGKVSFSTDETLQVHVYPSEIAAMEMFDESHTQTEAEVVANVEEMLVNESSSDLGSYMPNSYGNLAGTLERERKKIVTKDRDNKEGGNAKEEGEMQIDNDSTYKGDGNLFTETTSGSANAILF